MEIVERFGGIWKTANFEAGDVLVFTYRYIDMCSIGFIDGRCSLLQNCPYVNSQYNSLCQNQLWHQVHTINIWRRHVIGSLEIFLLTVQETIFVICWACVRTLPLRVSSCTKFVGSLHLPQTLLQGLRVGWLRGRNRSRRRGESNSVRLQTVWGLMNCGSQRRVKLPFLQLHCCQALVRSRLVWFCHPYTTMTKVRP